MIKPGKPITINKSIADTTTTIVFRNEELILTQVSSKSYGHKLKVINDVWGIMYLEDYGLYDSFTTRKVLIEKNESFSYLYWYYNFYEPVEIIGKGSEIEKYKEMFFYIQLLSDTYTPEKTLILRRKS